MMSRKAAGTNPVSPLTRAKYQWKSTLWLSSTWVGGDQWEVDAWMRKRLGRGLELDEEDADDAWRRQPNQLSSFQVEFSRSTACVAPAYAKALLKASMQFKILVEDKNYFSPIQIPCCHCPCFGVAPSTQNLSRCLRLKGFYVCFHLELIGK